MLSQLMEDVDRKRGGGGGASKQQSVPAEAENSI